MGYPRIPRIEEIEECLQEIETEIQYLELQKRRLQSNGGFFTPMKIAKLDEKLNNLRGNREYLKKLKIMMEESYRDGQLIYRDGKLIWDNGEKD